MGLEGVPKFEASVRKTFCIFQVDTYIVENERSMLKILYAGCLGLSVAISVQFTLEMCTAAKR